MATILLVEDDPDLNDINGEALRLAGHRVVTARSLAEAEAALESAVDLIVLDIMLPDGSGLDLARSLRGRRETPIIFLSALGQVGQRVEGLRAGGDDYLPKPYDLDELTARVEALLRRTRAAAPPKAMRMGALTIEFAPRRALVNGADIWLTPKEFAVLESLARAGDQFVSPRDLYQVVWGLNEPVDVRTVREHVYRLRGKLAARGTPNVESIRGKGYRLRPPQP
ncbi:MAG: response regulator transcription factor [Bifidobacteriaceae bacterium]|jgi:DNA-binding response OmpR family regulator|nr:response regulator transcription factor [Bifidobacteriaceae bacterium]